MKIAYTGFDKSGKSVAATVEAVSIADATDTLRRQGVYATDVREADAGAPAALDKKSPVFGKGKRLKLVSGFLRQMHVLVVTGTPLAESLMALEKQTADARFKATLADVRSRVEQGSPLSVAMATHAHYFNPICRGLVAAGESGGQLGAMLERLSVLSRKQVLVRSSIVGAMVYPILLTFVAVSVLVTLLTFVLPRFTVLFSSLGTPLPPTTKFLMTLSGLLIDYWWTLPLILGGGGFAVWSFVRSPAGRRKLDWLFISAPQFGPIVRAFETARVTRLLGILLQGRVPLLEALALTRDAVGNSYYANMLTHAEDAVTRGDSLAGAIGDPKLVNASVTEAVRSGEKSGQLGTLLSTLSDFLDEENEIVLRSLTSVIEPLILIILGVLVGVVAVSMFMPLFDLTAATGH